MGFRGGCLQEQPSLFLVNFCAKTTLIVVAPQTPKNQVWAPSGAIYYIDKPNFRAVIKLAASAASQKSKSRGPSFRIAADAARIAGDSYRGLLDLVSLETALVADLITAYKSVPKPQKIKQLGKYASKKCIKPMKMQTKARRTLSDRSRGHETPKGSKKRGAKAP